MAHIKIRCPHCHSELDGESEWVGQSASCPVCSKEFVIENDPPIRLRVSSPRKSPFEKAELWAAAGVIVLVLLGGAAAFLLKPEKKAPAPPAVTEVTIRQTGLKPEKKAPAEAPTPVPITLSERYQHAKKRLEELKEESPGQIRMLHDKKIRMREEQLRRIARQMAVRRKAKNLDLSQFDTHKTEDFKKRLEEYLKGKNGYGYNGRDLVFMRQLLQELKSGQIDPNLEITDARYARHSGPLIKFILSGRTPCETEVVTELIRLGADTSVVSLQDTKRYGRPGALILCQGGVDELKEVLLHYLSQHPMNRQVVSDLLFLNHNITERDKNGNTALHLAARAGNKDIAEQMICLDADVNATNKHGQTPLFEAVKYGDDALVSLLLSAGADRSVTDEDGKRAEDYGNIGKFRIAVSTNDINAAEDLLNEGVSPDIFFGTGDTALQTACLGGHVRMVKLLLERGADPDLSEARWFGSKTTPAQMVFLNRRERNAQIFSLLLQKGADPNKPPIGYGRGFTMLSFLCSMGGEDENEYLEALLSSERIDRDKFGRCLSTALRLRKSERFIEIFLAHVDTFAPGEVVLSQRDTRNYSQFLIQMLIQKGARCEKTGYPQTTVKRQLPAQKRYPSQSTTKRTGDASGWLPGPSGQWYVRMDTAIAAARRERKKIFVLSTGSDWCGWCKKLYNEVLSNPEFTDLAKRKMILVYLDNPHSKKMPELQKLYNRELIRALRRGGGVPSALVLDGDARLIGSIGGYRPLSKYMQSLEEILENEAADRPRNRPPEWIRKSPDQLIPMLEDLREKAARAAEAGEDAKKQVSLEVVAWGLDKDEVDRPFDSRREIRIPAGTTVYFKVRYRMPAALRAMFFLRMAGCSTSGPGKTGSGDGEFTAMLRSQRPNAQTKMRIYMLLRMAESRPVLAAELPCNVRWE